MYPTNTRTEGRGSTRVAAAGNQSPRVPIIKCKFSFGSELSGLVHGRENMRVVVAVVVFVGGRGWLAVNGCSFLLSASRNAFSVFCYYILN